MTVINAFPDKVECPLATCDYKDEPEAKGLCAKRRCPFPQATRDRWLDIFLVEEYGDEPL